MIKSQTGDSSDRSGRRGLAEGEGKMLANDRGTESEDQDNAIDEATPASLHEQSQALKRIDTMKSAGAKESAWDGQKPPTESRPARRLFDRA